MSTAGQAGDEDTEMQEDGDRGLHEEEERDEEEMYVLLDLASLGRLKLAENIMPGQTIQLQVRIEHQDAVLTAELRV